MKKAFIIIGVVGLVGGYCWAAVAGNCRIKVKNGTTYVCCESRGEVYCVPY